MWFRSPQDVKSCHFLATGRMGNNPIQTIPQITDTGFLVAAVTETPEHKSDGERVIFLSIVWEEKRISSWDGRESQYFMSFGAVSPDWEEMV